MKEHLAELEEERPVPLAAIESARYYLARLQERERDDLW
jgi:hypothetical protein